MADRGRVSKYALPQVIKGQVTLGFFFPLAEDQFDSTFKLAVESAYKYSAWCQAATTCWECPRPIGMDHAFRDIAGMLFAFLAPGRRRGRPQGQLFISEGLLPSIVRQTPAPAMPSCRREPQKTVAIRRQVSACVRLPVGKVSGCAWRCRRMPKLTLRAADIG